MIYDKRSPLAGFIVSIMAERRNCFTAKEAVKATGVNHGAFLDAAERLQKRRKIVSPKRGFYVIVHPVHASRGAPPPEDYVDAMMRYLGLPYYVGLHTAATFHGAARRKAQVFQVVTPGQMKPMTVGSSRIEFHYRKYIDQVSGEVMDLADAGTGKLRLSSPELTALDLLRYHKGYAGFGHTAAVLADIIPKVNPRLLAELSDVCEKPALQRLGHHLDRLGFKDHADALHDAVCKRGRLRWMNLVVPSAREVATEAPPSRDARWKVEVSQSPDPA